MAQISVHLSSLVNDQNPTLRALRAFGKEYLSDTYRLAENPRDADIILFVENGYVGLGEISKARRIQRENAHAIVAMFSECDWPFTFLPGLYSSLVKRLPWASSWAFVLDDTEVSSEVECRYVYSFLGRLSTHPVRNAIRLLDGPLNPCLDISDAQPRFPDWDYRKTFAQVLRESRFVLCPRGIGASSIRIFEAMRAGRVPVIVSDAWIEPPMGNWADFSIRVRESDVARIPDICANFAASADAMGHVARSTFEEHFAPTKFLDRALDFIRSSVSKSVHSPVGFSTRVLKSLSVREFKTAGHGVRHVLSAGHA